MLKGWLVTNNLVFPKCAGVRGSAESLSALDVTLVDSVALALLTAFSFFVCAGFPHFLVLLFPGSIG